MQLLEMIECHLRTTRTAATSFGRKAVRDPRFVLDIRKGRIPSAEVERRVRRFIHAGQQETVR